jgi:hypothetical protein
MQNLGVQANCVVRTGGEEPRLSRVEENFEDSKVSLLFVVVEALQGDDQRVLKKIAVGRIK